MNLSAKNGANKFFKTLVIIFALLLLLIALYYSFKTKGDVATIVSGLWSALSTVVLGLIALTQSSRYKKLSDKTNYEFHNLQIEIKNLTNNMAETIDTLRRIERAKYYPNLVFCNHTITGVTKESFAKITADINNVLQMNYLNLSFEEISNIGEIVEDCKVLAFKLKNIGEKAIRNFNCVDIQIPHVTDGEHSVFYYLCDIQPGQFVYVSIVNIPEAIFKEGASIEIRFKMENLIFEKYLCGADIVLYGETPFANIEISPQECIRNVLQGIPCLI